MEKSEKRVAEVWAMLASCIVVFVALKWGAPVFTPVVAGVCLALFFFSYVSWLAFKGVSTVWSSVSVVLYQTALLVATAWLDGILDAELTNDWPAVAEALGPLQENVQAIFRRFSIESSHSITDIAGLPQRITVLPRHRIGSLPSVVAAMSVSFLILALLGDSEKVARLAPHKSKMIYAKFVGLADDVQKYLSIKIFTSVLVAIVIYGTLKLVGAPLPTLMALLMFLLHFFPVVGPLLAAIPSIALIEMQRGGWVALIAVGALLAAVVTVGGVLEPKLRGHLKPVPSLFLLLSLLVWTWLWGLTGALLSVPIAVTLRGVLQRGRLAWVTVLAEGVAERPAHLEADEIDGPPARKTVGEGWNLGSTLAHIKQSLPPQRPMVSTPKERSRLLTSDEPSIDPEGSPPLERVKK